MLKHKLLYLMVKMKWRLLGQQLRQLPQVKGLCLQKFRYKLATPRYQRRIISPRKGPMRHCQKSCGPARSREAPRGNRPYRTRRKLSLRRKMLRGQQLYTGANKSLLRQFYASDGLRCDSFTATREPKTFRRRGFNVNSFQRYTE